MNYSLEIIVFILGACIGSFLNVCIYRIPKEESVVYNASYCTNCNTKLRPWDLVPILSFFLLKGRCRYCEEKISLQYPLVEIVTALLFLAALNYWGISWYTIAMWVFISILVSVSVIDIYHQIIPNEILLVGAILGLPMLFLTSFQTLLSGLIGFFVAGLLLLAIALVSKGGMGGGDIKLSAVMGLFLGWKGVLVALFIAFLIGGLCGIFMLATGIKGRKDAIPFGPYLAVGALMAVFWAEKLIFWYLKISGLA